MRAWAIGVGLVLGGCSGGDGVVRSEPEICDDGVDNNDDGLTDCEDKSSCGGLACADNDDTEVPDTTIPLPDVEVLYTPQECCNFDFGPGDCPQKTVGSITFANRVEDRATIDLSCNLVGGESVIQWATEDRPEPIDFVVDYDVDGNTELTFDGVFVCAPGVGMTFTTSCFAKISAGEYIEDTVEFDVTGTAVQ